MNLAGRGFSLSFSSPAPASPPQIPHLATPIQRTLQPLGNVGDLTAPISAHSDQVIEAALLQVLPPSSGSARDHLLDAIHGRPSKVQLHVHVEPLARARCAYVQLVQKPNTGLDVVALVDISLAPLLLGRTVLGRTEESLSCVKPACLVLQTLKLKPFLLR